ncbi:hypothetical protein [Paraburkholderia sp. BCC1885]|uniref:hypothetical protein n=1 Tax=Paraburkholderia sp. BCC1885 TaxID=2562669 RepID=UPI001182CA7C|nr:hypothetical protein [Paraburkholderia sp. BCC1885]
MFFSASLGVISAVLQSFIFIVYDLAGKRLREHGVAALELSSLLRLALLPSLCLLAATWQTADIKLIIANRASLWSFYGYLTASLLFQWVYFQYLHVSHSLAVASVTRNAIGLPLLMICGVVINRDNPTVWGIAGLGFMIAASLVRPGRARTDSSQYIESARTVVALATAFVILVAIKDPLYRFWLQRSGSLLLATALYMTAFTAALNLYFWARPPKRTITWKSSTPKIRWLLLAVPMLWFAGTIPEGVAFGLLPAYSAIAIGSVAWLFTMASDIYFGRLAMTARCALFGGLVTLGVLLQILDRSSS